ncbi:MAG: pyrroline-5-carboxylate reductase [Oscillospiraceae bacterium]|jgi:pyrroline-5-carboxylate reductase|nr:pyrroline-5-carboxylate reductase [Oscillospiraceae bacterium]
MITGFIGVGNMGGALLRGMLQSGALTAENACCCDGDSAKTNALASEHGVSIAESAPELARRCDLIVLAVKPDAAPSVLQSISGALGKDKILLSIVLGLSIKKITMLTGGACRVVRVMPNTPALVGAGAMCTAFGEGLTEAEKDKITALLSACGEAAVMDERLLARITGLTASSPAYVFIMIDAMADAAVRNGIPRATARRLAAQAVLGSAKMALESDEHPAQLKDNVCSPSGSTIEAVRALERHGFRSAIIEAIIACDARAEEISGG